MIIRRNFKLDLTRGCLSQIFLDSRLQDVGDVKDGIERGHLLMREARCQLLLEVVLDLTFLVLEDVG